MGGGGGGYSYVMLLYVRVPLTRSHQIDISHLLMFPYSINGILNANYEHKTRFGLFFTIEKKCLKNVKLV
jgi:hypothetical protein